MKTTKSASETCFYYVPDGAFDKTVKQNAPLVGENTCIGNNAYIVGSSHGLVCLSQHHCLSIALWNPSTNECKELPSPNNMFGLFHVDLYFGFHPIINDYKVVKLSRSRVSTNPTRYRVDIEMYSLSTNSWGKVRSFQCNVLWISSRAVLNGGIHWIGSFEDVLDKWEFILAYDMSNEKLRVVAKLPEVFRTPLCLKAFKGCLSLTVLDHLWIDVWMMKEYGVEASWSKLFRVVDWSLFPLPIDLLSDGQILIKHSQCGLVSYDSKTGETNHISTPKLENQSVIDGVPYRESLVLLRNRPPANEDMEIQKIIERCLKVIEDD